MTNRNRPKSAAGLALMIGMLVAIAASFVLPDAKGFREPGMARIIFWHLPCAFITVGFLFAAAWNGWKYLQTRKPVWDLRGAATLELGTLFAALTMATGILFSKVQWGAWWQNDPRQTSFLMVLLIFAGGLALRAGLADEMRRAAAGAGYALFALIPNLFLIFVFPRLPRIQRVSFHPSQTIQTGGFDGAYWLGIILVLAMLTWVGIALCRLRVRIGLAQLELENRDGNVEAGRGSPASSSVVRPIPVSSEPGDAG